MRTSSLAGRSVVVVGASSGIGRGVAERAITPGAHVVLGARRAGVLSEIVDQSGGGHAVPTDLRDDESCTRLATEVGSLKSPVDLLLISAGIAPLRPMARTTADDWDTAISTNLVGIHRVIVALLEHLSHSAVVAVVSSEVVHAPRSHLGAYWRQQGGPRTYAGAVARGAPDRFGLPPSHSEQRFRPEFGRESSSRRHFGGFHGLDVGGPHDIGLHGHRGDLRCLDRNTHRGGECAFSGYAQGRVPVAGTARDRRGGRARTRWWRATGSLMDSVDHSSGRQPATCSGAAHANRRGRPPHGGHRVFDANNSRADSRLSPKGNPRESSDVGRMKAFNTGTVDFILREPVQQLL